MSEPAFLTDVDLRQADKQMLLSVAGLHNLFHLELDISFLCLDYLLRSPFEFLEIDIIQHNIGNDNTIMFESQH